jgi:2-keto-4-pentenoate hydratase/2-oxohepta-3-ene-1,7-dioic acid hydratase in catechol pathway
MSGGDFSGWSSVNLLRLGRELQLERGGQWDKGKSCETFEPLGLSDTPYLRPGDVLELEIDGLGRQRQVSRQG